MKTKRLMVILLMSLAVPVPCWAVVGQMTKLEDKQVSMAPLLTDYVDMIQFGAQKGRERFYGLQVGGPWGLFAALARMVVTNNLGGEKQ
jgi:hypothetical protein